MPKIRLKKAAARAVKAAEQHGAWVERYSGDIIMQIKVPDGSTRTFPIPNHNELHAGVLGSIARKAGLPSSVFQTQKSGNKQPDPIAANGSQAPTKSTNSPGHNADRQPAKSVSPLEPSQLSPAAQKVAEAFGQALADQPKPASTGFGRLQDVSDSLRNDPEHQAKVDRLAAEIAAKFAESQGKAVTGTGTASGGSHSQAANFSPISLNGKNGQFPGLISDPIPTNNGPRILINIPAGQWGGIASEFPPNIVINRIEGKNGPRIVINVPADGVPGIKKRFPGLILDPIAEAAKSRLLAGTSTPLSPTNQPVYHGGNLDVNLGQSQVVGKYIARPENAQSAIYAQSQPQSNQSNLENDNAIGNMNRMAYDSPGHNPQSVLPYGPTGAPGTIYKAAQPLGDRSLASASGGGQPIWHLETTGPFKDSHGNYVEALPQGDMVVMPQTKGNLGTVFHLPAGSNDAARENMDIVANNPRLAGGNPQSVYTYGPLDQNSRSLSGVKPPGTKPTQSAPPGYDVGMNIGPSHDANQNIVEGNSVGDLLVYPKGGGFPQYMPAGSNAAAKENMSVVANSPGHNPQSVYTYGPPASQTAADTLAAPSGGNPTPAPPPPTETNPLAVADPSHGVTN